MVYAPGLSSGPTWGVAIKFIGRRWSRRAPAALAVAVLALAPLETGAGADPQSTSETGSFVAGSGRARASLFEIAPRTGGLAIPVNFGKALVTYQGLSATATSGALKPPEQKAAGGECGTQPPPGGGDGGGGGGAPAPPSPGGGSGPPTSFPFVSTLAVSTGEKDAEKGKSMNQGSFPAGSPVQGEFQHQLVQADAKPTGRATSTSGRMALGPLVEIVNGRTEAQAGVVDGKARVASAVTTMDRLNLLGGLITLGDVRWEATHRTGEGEAADGSFTVGSVLLQGQPLPAPPAPPVSLPGGAPAPVLPDPMVALNTALAPTGLALELPRFSTDGGVARVGPLSLRFADSPMGAAVLAPLVTSLQPLRDPIVNGLLAYSCDFGIAVTVADVATGILTGTGGINFDFGGVTATTEGEAYDNPFAGGPGEDNANLGDGDLGAALPELAPLPATGSADFPAGAAFTDPGVTGGGGAGFDSGGIPAGGGSVRRPGLGSNPAGDEIAFDDMNGLFGSTSKHVPGQKGGRAVAVAALALLTVAALAAADALHLRRASRSIS